MELLEVAFSCLLGWKRASTGYEGVTGLDNGMFPYNIPRGERV